MIQIFICLMGREKKLSETYQMFTNERTLEGNPGVIVKLTNLNSLIFNG